MKRSLLTGIIVFLGIISLLTGLAGCHKASTEPEPEPAPFVRLLEHQSIQSKILNRPIHFAVLFPKEYENSTTLFPVVYLLHGFGESETGWYKWGNIEYYVDQFAAETVPMIYVMPEGFNTYYVNKYSGSFNYMNMFVNELVPAIDSLFRTIKDAQHRAVMGYSMGGYGAMILPCKNPGVFKTGVVLSMSFRTDSQYVAEPQGVFDYQWATVFGGIGVSGTSRINDYFKSCSPYHFAGASGDSSLDGVNLFIDCGDDEETLTITNDAFHDTLRNLGIGHEYRVRNGAHTWDYWHHALPEALKYIAYAVRQMPYPAEPDPVDPGPPVPADRLIAEELPATGIRYTVALPSGYAGGSATYPLIIVLHDRSQGSQDVESQELFSLLNTSMTAGKLPGSLVVEIPLQETQINSEILQNVLDQVRAKYRTINDKGHVILLGNDQAGRLAWELMPGFSLTINSCLLFNADLPGDASVNGGDVTWYMDICDQGNGYTGYHSLYKKLRQDNVSYEYRVRQGTPSHDSFLDGLNQACQFMKDHLKSQAR
jgi:enterochelin esterase-like enzyme